MYDIFIGVLRTWCHILLGIGAGLFLLCVGALVSRWYNAILEQIDEARNSGKLPKI